MSVVVISALVWLTAMAGRRAAGAHRRARVVQRLGLVPPAAPMALPWPRLSARRRVAARDAAVPELLEGLARAVRGGSSLSQALLDAPLPAALVDDVASMRSKLLHGVPAPRVFAEWRSQAASHPMRLGAAALELAARGGGAMARALDAVAGSLRERQAVQGEIRALAAQAQTSAAVIAALPIGFAVLASLTEPASLVFLVTTPVGGGCLVAGVALELGGGLWMRRIIRAVPW